MSEDPPGLAARRASDELRDLLQRYARAVDDRDLDLLESLFDPEAIIEGARGTLGRAAWMDTMRAPRAFPVSMHVIGEPLIVLRRGAQPDGATPDGATLDTYAIVYQLGDRAGGQADLTLGLRYLDEVVRRDGRWVFRHRTAQVLWMR